MILWGLGGGFFEPFCNSGDSVAEHSMDGRSGDQVALRQLAKAVALLAVTMDCGSIENQGFPSDVPSFELGPPHAGAHTLDDQAALQLCDGADDDHDCPA